MADKTSSSSPQPTSPQSASPQPASSNPAATNVDTTRADQATIYVRPRPEHRSVEPIDDFAQEADPLTDLPHESAYVPRSSMLEGRSYRRSRAEISQLRKNLQYGQYLEIPKGRREIFVSREKRSRLKTVIALLLIILILAVVIVCAWHYMQANWGAIS